VTSAPDRHPSREALAEFAGGPGDLDGAGRAAGAGGPPPGAAARIRDHLAGCPRCRDEVAMLRTAASALATLTEPALPPGLHERLVAAVRAERLARAPGRADSRADRGVGSRVDSRAAVGGPRAGRRRARTWRPFGWAVAAAAAAVLVVAGVSELGRQGGDVQFASGGGGAGEATSGSGGGTAMAPDAAGGVPRFQADGEYDLARLRADLAGRPEMHTAYQTAFDAARRTRASAAPGSVPGSSAAPTSEGASPFAESPSSKSAQQDLAKRDDAAAGCPAATATPGTFLVEADYRGRPATVVVSVAGEPPVVTMRAYARDDCTPLGTEQGPAPAP
jgi:Putative zinc-finger